MLASEPSLEQDCMWCLRKANGSVSCCGWRGVEVRLEAAFTHPFTFVSLLYAVTTGISVCRFAQWLHSLDGEVHYDHSADSPWSGIVVPWLLWTGRFSHPEWVGYKIFFYWKLFKNQKAWPSRGEVIEGAPVSPKSFTNNGKPLKCSNWYLSSYWFVMYGKQMCVERLCSSNAGYF